MHFIRKNFQLQLDDRQGNIVSLLDCRKKQYIGQAHPLIRIALLDCNGERRIISSNDAVCSVIRYGDDRCTVRFHMLGGERLSCTATVRFDDSLSYWRLQVENNTSDLLEWIEYPCIAVPCDLRGHGGNFKIFSSMMEGVEISDASLRELTGSAAVQAYPPRGWEGVYPGAAPMQFLAYYDGQYGLYFASHDTGGAYKFVEWKKERETIRLIQQTYPQAERNCLCELEYDVVLGVFEGDWYGAAEIYRRFVKSSGMLRIPPLSQNKDVPQWFKQSPIVVTYPVRGWKDHGNMEINAEYYPFVNAMSVLDGYRKAWDSKLLVLLMHWESTAPWAPPYVWPPMGGGDILQKFAVALHEQGDLLGLYCSGLGWTQQSGIIESYNREELFCKEGLASVVEVGPDHALRYTPICGWPIRRGYDMCPACDKVKQIATREVCKIARGVDVDYIQFFDQNLGGNTYACYSETHGHPPVPGKWMVEAMRVLVSNMQNELRAISPHKRIVLGCEAAACEPLVNDLMFNDSRYNINYKFGTPVPAYSYVFHGYVCNFMGNHNCSSMLVDVEKYPEYVYYRYAYYFLQGDILTVVLKNGGKINWEWNVPWDDNVQPDQAQLSNYIRLLNDIRKAYPEYLQYGIMQRPYRIDTNEIVLELRIGNAKQYMAAVLTIRYLGEDGSDCQILANWTGGEQTVQVYVGACRLYSGADRTQFENLRGEGLITIKLQPREVKVLLL